MAVFNPNKYAASNCRMICEWWLRKFMERTTHS
jgi:hypothetical protein